MAWKASPECPKHLVDVLEKAVNALEPNWLLEPVTGEVFDDSKHCENRLHGFALSQGFEIVISGGGTKQVPRVSFLCIFHGSKTRNTRNLEDRIELNDDGIVVSNRKRENTNLRQSQCPFEVAVSFKDWPKRGCGNKKWVLTVKSSEHSHAMLANPLSIPSHLNRLEEFQQAKRTAIQHRIAVIPFKQSRRVLEHEEFGITLTPKQYYNTVRKQSIDQSNPDSVMGLLVALQDAGFVYQPRIQLNEDNSGTVVSRKLLQIWFSHPDLVKACRKFVSDFILLIDGTFNTNKLRMPLLIAVGILNNGKTFPVAFSYCKSESQESFEFFFESLKLYAFSGFDSSDPESSLIAVPPRVIMADQAPGIVSAIEKVFPDAVFQCCNWHAVEAMKAKFRRSGRYSKEDIDGLIVDGKKEKLGLSDRCWTYIKSSTTSALVENRQALIETLKPQDRSYIDEFWREKEPRVVDFYTRKYRNLGANSTQRSESYHNVIREITNGQLTLENSVKRLIETIKSILKDLENAEDSAKRSFPRLAQSFLYRNLQFKVSNLAISLIEREFDQLKASMAPGIPLDPCDCEILNRSGIACRHYLKSIYENGDSIPLTFFHPRWLLNGAPILSTNWCPTLRTNEPPDAIREPITPNGDLARVYYSLQASERVTFTRQIETIQANANNSMLILGQQTIELQGIPISMPDPIPKRKIIQKHAHGRANARGLTSAELADIELTQRERNTTPNVENSVPISTQESTIQVLQSPTRSIETTMLPIRSPERVTPLPIDSIPNIPNSPNSIELTPPSSTAPPRLGEEQGRGKRKRRATEKYTNAIDRGYIRPSHKASKHQEQSIHDEIQASDLIQDQ